MRLPVLAACVLLSSLLTPLLAYAGERIERAERAERTWRVERLRLRASEQHRHDGGVARLFAPAAAYGSDTSLRVDEMIHRAENTLMAAVENVQHLGSQYRTWLWVEPMSGGSGVYGAAVRIEYR
jgi:hypothetical protein